MKTRIIVSAILLPLFFAVLFWLPPIVLTALISVICAIAAWEFTKAVSNFCDSGVSTVGGERTVGTNNLEKGYVTLRPAFYAIIVAALMPFVVFLSGSVGIIAFMTSSSDISQYDPYNSLSVQTFISLILVVTFILICLLVIDFLLNFRSCRRIRLLQFLTAPIAGLVIPLMLSALVALKMMPSSGHLLVLLPIVVTFLTDSGAYFTGVAIGKKKAFPTISPNKTVEGCVGGIVAGIAGILIYGLVLDLTTPLVIAYLPLTVLGLAGAFVTEAGDLVFSYIKRKCGIKDYGSLIPGHGGVLDRFDSMAFTAPSMFLLATLLPVITRS
ncbi:MAG: phosphatidate cytidylyltransferase [Oscillospiraceae bacterium]|nr:phosphatidate cytidylyltransferase [Oscillospiraceae bacterium]